MRGRMIVFVGLIVCLGLFAVAQAQDFTRVLEIPYPESDLNNGGVGDIIAGVDLDGDGLLEIYTVNDNWNDTPGELVPRIYKLEQAAADDYSTWNVVWQGTPPVLKQNTWPPLAVADLDDDGNQEIVWGIVNNTGDEPNPDRIVVFEVAGDGSDVLGVDIGGGLYGPNAGWSIVAEDDINLRTSDIDIADPDGDGVDEIIFSDRKGNDDGYYFGVISVDDVPDTGDGSETWTLEVSGKDFGDLAAADIENKWDVAVLGSNIYTFCEIEISKLAWDGVTWNYTALDPLEGGASFLSSQVVDLDCDGVREIICGVYDWGDDDKKAIMLLQEDNGTLTHTEIANISAYYPSGSRGIIGGDCGDIDGDGYLDFVFGTRGCTPNGAIFRLAYKGGDITDPSNYELTVIDSEYADGGIWNVIQVANMDADSHLEVVYASSTDAGVFPNTGTQDIVVLDYTGGVALDFDDLVVAPEVLLNGAVPTDLNFKPGRILDDGNTVWFAGLNGTTKESYVFRSIDGGATFTHNAVPMDGRVAQMDAFDANTALVATANGKIYKTTDGGATFEEKYSYVINVIAPGWFDGCRVLNDNVAVAFGDMEPDGDMHFVRTTDQGDTWTEITGIDYLGAAYGYYTWGTAACNVGEVIWCAATNTSYDASFVFRSRDAGLTWTSYEIPDEIIATYPRSIAFSNSCNGLIADRRGNVVKSTDGGATWMETNNPDVDGSWVNSVVAVPGTNIIIGMDDVGVFYTTDLGASWGEITTPAETDNDYITSGVMNCTNFGFAFTDNGLVLRFENQTTDVASQHDGTLPTSFRLGQNYPNPFNPSTSIPYHVAQDAAINLKIYDMLGREVKTLVDQHMIAGSHIAEWNGTDNLGNSMPSGRYIYRLNVNGVVLSKQMTFMK